MSSNFGMQIFTMLDDKIGLMVKKLVLIAYIQVDGTGYAKPRTSTTLEKRLKQKSKHFINNPNLTPTWCKRLGCPLKCKWQLQVKFLLLHWVFSRIVFSWSYNILFVSHIGVKSRAVPVWLWLTYIILIVKPWYTDTVSSRNIWGLTVKYNII